MTSTTNYLHVTYAYLCHPPGTTYLLHYQITIHQPKLNGAFETSMAYILASLPLPLHSKCPSPTRPRAGAATHQSLDNPYCTNCKISGHHTEDCYSKGKQRERKEDKKDEKKEKAEKSQSQRPRKRPIRLWRAPQMTMTTVMTIADQTHPSRLTSPAHIHTRTRALAGFLMADQ